jgi:integrase
LTIQISDQLVAATLADPNRPSTVELIDGLEPGLRLRIGAVHRRWSYLTRATTRARLRIPLGAWPEVSVADARRLVARLKATLDQPDTDDGGAMTVGDLVNRYDARRLSQLRKQRVMLRAITVALAPVWHLEPSALGRRHISEIVDGMADRAPIHANRVLAYLKAFFGWAVGRGYLEVSPAAGISKPSRETTRERTPTVDELVEIWEASSSLGYPFGPIIKLLILTASRRDEVGAMRVEEVSLSADGDEGCWTLPASRSKNGRAIRMPLGVLGCQVAQDALRGRPSAGPFVFSTTGTTPVSGWSRAKSRLDKLISQRRRGSGVRADMEPWRIHDLRRAFATAACDVLQVDPAVADRCLNHVGAATTSTVSRIYGRNEMFDQRREALLKWEQLLLSAGCRSAPTGCAPTEAGRAGAEAPAGSAS